MKSCNEVKIMGQPRKYYMKTINFGLVGNPARILTEQYLKLNGKQSLSKLIRKLVICYLQNNPEYNSYKIDYLLYERKRLGNEIAIQIDKRHKVEDKLKEYGVDVDSIL